MKLLRFILMLPIAIPLLFIGIALDALTGGRVGPGIGALAFWLLGVLDSVQ